MENWHRQEKKTIDSTVIAHLRVSSILGKYCYNPLKNKADKGSKKSVDLRRYLISESITRGMRLADAKQVPSIEKTKIYLPMISQ